MLQIIVGEEDRGATCGSRGFPWAAGKTSYLVHGERSLVTQNSSWTPGEVLEALEGRLGEDRDQVWPGEHSSRVGERESTA